MEDDDSLRVGKKLVIKNLHNATTFTNEPIYIFGYLLT